MPKREDDYTITLTTNTGRSITLPVDEFDRRVKALLRMTPEEKRALLDAAERLADGPPRKERDRE